MRGYFCLYPWSMHYLILYTIQPHHSQNVMDGIALEKNSYMWAETKVSILQWNSWKTEDMVKFEVLKCTPHQL